MSTRRLIATALVCGVLILVAGMVFLLRLPSPEQVPERLPATTSSVVAAP